MGDHSVRAAGEQPGDQPLTLVDRHGPIPVDPAVHSLELATLDEAVELAFGQAELVGLGGGDELVPMGEVVDEQSVHQSSDGLGVAPGGSGVELGPLAGRRSTRRSTKCRQVSSWGRSRAAGRRADPHAPAADDLAWG